MLASIHGKLKYMGCQNQLCQKPHNCFSPGSLHARMAFKEKTFVLFNLRKKNWTISHFSLSSLRSGHANLLCLVPLLSDVPKGTLMSVDQIAYKFHSDFVCDIVAIHVQDIIESQVGIRVTLQAYLLVINYNNEAMEGEQPESSEFSHVRV